MKKGIFRLFLAGAGAGAVNSCLGTGGGAVLLPLMSRSGELEEAELFPASAAVMLPICVTSLLLRPMAGIWQESLTLPCLLGAVPGGIAAGLWGSRVNPLWLRRAFGLLALWGGIRCFL